MGRESPLTLFSRSPTLEIAAVCVFVFGLQWLLALAVGRTAMYAMFALAWPLTAAPWTLVTSVYAHDTATLGHLLGNLVMLLLVGLPLERLTTRLRFHLFFLLTGAAAGVFQLLVSDPLAGVPLFGGGGTAAVLGASGAIFALLGYLLTSNRVTDSLLARLGISTRLQVLLLAVTALIVAFATATAPNVALWGHFFGLFAGLLAGRANLLRVSASG
jgi:membrane associated rhomboid family serine protease